MICVSAATDNYVTNNYQWSNYGRLGYEQYGLLADSLDDVLVRGRVCDRTFVTMEVDDMSGRFRWFVCAGDVKSEGG